MVEESSDNPQEDRPIGRLFTEIYRDRGEARQDDERFRVQLDQAFRDIFSDHDSGIAWHLRATAGIEIPHHEEALDICYEWSQHFAGCSIEDLLDLITHFAWFAISERLDSLANQWILRVRHALAAHNMAYDVDDRGGMHHKVDAAFQRSTELTLACLAAARFEAAKADVEAAFDSLTQIQSDAKIAVMKIFMAAENVFKLIAETGTPLTSGSVNKELRSIVQKRYMEFDETANRSYNAMVSSLADWVDACHPYRHGQKELEIVAPPMPLAITLVTVGADYIRWMVALT